MNSSSSDRELHRMDTDMSTKSVLGVFAVILIGLVFTFWEFVSAVPIRCWLNVDSCCSGHLSSFINRLLRSCSLWLHGRSYRYICISISGIGILATIISSLVVYFIASENNLFATQAGVQFPTAMAIFMTSVVIAIASISNDNLQDLKTGQLVGATPLASTNCVVTWFRSRCSCNCSSSLTCFTKHTVHRSLPRAEMDPNAALSAPQNL